MRKAAGRKRAAEDLKDYDAAEKVAAKSDVIAAAVENLRAKQGGRAQSALETQVGGDHYKGLAIQPVEFSTRNRLSFPSGNVVKYVCRHSVTHDVEDLDKAIHYLQIERELLYGKAAA